MENRLNRNVTFDVDIYDPRQGTIWTQRFIKPFVNYVEYTDNGIKVLRSGQLNENGVCVSHYDLFNEEVLQTINAFANEEGEDFDDIFSDCQNDKLTINIGVTPHEDVENDGYIDGYFDFYNDRISMSLDWKEVREFLIAKILKIKEEDGFSPIIKRKEVA